MEDRKIGKRLGVAINAVASLLFVTASARAEMLHASVRIETAAGAEKTVAVSYLPATPRSVIPARHNDEQALLKGLQHEWQTLREELTRSAVEAAMTMFFIQAGSPPSIKPPAIALTITPPPILPGMPTIPTPPPPPPPTGSGEPAPINPPVDPFTVTTPEPAALLLAFIGSSWLSFYGWRKRFRTNKK